MEAPVSTTAPCDDSFTGRRMFDWCRDCGHALAVHRQDYVCSVCDAIAVLRVELKSDS